MNNTFTKVRFYSHASGATAGLIFDTDKLNRMSISDISRFFPYSEANKMRHFQRSPEMPDWESAFLYSFPNPDL